MVDSDIIIFLVQLNLYVIVTSYQHIHTFAGENSIPISLSEASICPNGFHDLRIYMIQNQPVITLNDCSNLCDVEPKCKYFHYRISTPSEAQCGLFGTLPEAQSYNFTYCLKDSKHFNIIEQIIKIIQFKITFYCYYYYSYFIIKNLC